jgi:hypothetical protein
MLPTTSSNVLALPIAAAEIETGTNEDWVDDLTYLVDNGSGDPTTMSQIDLRGLAFKMSIRRAPKDHEVVIKASTDDGTIAVGFPPNFGILILYVPLATMKTIEAGGYVGDIVAIDPVGLQRRILTIDLTVVEGITR